MHFVHLVSVVITLEDHLTEDLQAKVAEVKPFSM